MPFVQIESMTTEQSRLGGLMASTRQCHPDASRHEIVEPSQGLSTKTIVQSMPELRAEIGLCHPGGTVLGKSQESMRHIFHRHMMRGNIGNQTSDQKSQCLCHKQKKKQNWKIEGESWMKIVLRRCKSRENSMICER